GVTMAVTPTHPMVAAAHRTKPPSWWFLPQKQSRPLWLFYFRNKHPYVVNIQTGRILVVLLLIEHTLGGSIVMVARMVGMTVEGDDDVWWCYGAWHGGGGVGWHGSGG
ncbi:hypothetical protein Tco_0240079, partial [Tanacetum coccineum]